MRRRVATSNASKAERYLMHRIFHDKYDFIVQYRAKAQQTQGKSLEDCSTYERYASLAYLIASIARDMAGRSEAEAVKRGKKRVYYFSSSSSSAASSTTTSSTSVFAASSRMA